MPHWREMMTSDKLFAVDLDGKDRIVTIVRVVQGEYPDFEDPKRKLKKPDVYFKEFTKPLGLNSTNARAISRLFGSPKTEEWIGKRLVLYPTITKAFGEEHECIRVRNKRIPDEPIAGPPRAQGSQQQARPTQPPPARTNEPHPNAPISADEAAEIARLERETR